MMIFKNNLVQKASQDEVGKYLQLQHCIQQNNGRIVFRGETVDYISRALRVDFSVFPLGLNQALSLIYMLGSKGNFYQDKSHFSSFISRSSEDISEEVFKQVFNLIHNVVSSPHRYGGEVKNAIKKLKFENKCFYEFFIDQKKYDRLYEMFQGESDLSKMIFRDYLFMFLHTLEVERYHSRSYLISTSTELKTSEDFAGENGVVYEYFIPQPLYRYCTSFAVGPSLRKFLSRYGLPELTSPIYGNECEYSVRRALLPHFILRIQNKRYKEWILNPMFSQIEEAEVNKISSRGFVIDQTNFFKELKKTNYKTFGVLQSGRWRQG